MDVLWLIPIGLLAFACCLGTTAYLRNARESQLAQLEPVMFPHPHPRPPLPPSRISSLTNLVELVIEIDTKEKGEDPV